MSATQSRFGRAATKRRSTRSAGRDAVSSETVMRHFVPRTAPEIPSSGISRSTEQRATVMCSRFNWRQIFRAERLELVPGAGLR